MESMNVYKPPTRFAPAKTDSLNLYMPLDMSTYLYMPPTSLAAVISDSANVYMLLTGFSAVKTMSTNVLNLQTNFQTLLQSKQTPQTSISLSHTLP